MNMTAGTASGNSIGPANSFLTVKNAVNNGNSKNNNKAYMQHLKSADEVMVERRGAAGASGSHALKSDATTAADTSHVTSSFNQKPNEVLRQ